MRNHRLTLIGIPVILAVAVSTSRGQDDPSDEQLAFFERKIRPILVNECYDCHSADSDEIQGGLVVDSRLGLQTGGDSGPAVVPGNLRRSLLIKAIKHIDDDMAMPPDNKLPADVIKDFEKWISMGAPDPRNGSVAAPKDEIDIAAGRQFWSFRPPQKTSIPAVRDTQWPQTDVDRFVLAKLESKELKPVSDANPNTLVRRLYFDLIGLPPNPQEIDDFVAAHRSDPQAAIATTVDRLLESPLFGERWARHWLDVVRFAESSGGSSNVTYPHAWRYRDYVITALNHDKPYDQFLREQIAGDLLRHADQTEEAEHLVATGFSAIGTKSHNERDRRQFRADLADEQIDATFQAFQALTVACARCHDHKFDPIPQSDYYALAGIFASTETCYGTIRVIQSNQPSDLIELPKESGASTSRESFSDSRRASTQRQIERLQERLGDLRGSEQIGQRILVTTQLAQLKSRLESYNEDGSAKALAMGVRDRRLTFDVPLLIRGEIDQPSDRIRRGFPQVLIDRQPRIPRGSSGRMQLANWIASPDNPLTARVMVNRVWLHLMGRGIVPTPDNFGASGLPPSHPELLDHLALKFVEQDWSIKELIRSITSSRAYRLSSDFDERQFAIDPDNEWLWRMPKRRMEAEAIRDTMLLLAGNLDFDPVTGGPVATAGEGNVNFLLRSLDGSLSQDTHRSVYLPIVRDQLPESMTMFDFPDPSLIVGERSTTTIPSQALYLLNNPFVIRQSEGLATRLLSAPGNDSAKVRLAYQLCYSRLPSSRELSNSQKFLRNYARDHSIRASWSAFSQALMASAEFAQR